jgi:hypothetical protein
MSGLSEGPEHRTDRLIDQICGVSPAICLSPMPQPVRHPGTSQPAQLACPPGRSQTATRGHEKPCVPAFSLLTRTAKRIPPIAHTTAQKALRTGQISQGVPDLDTNVERPAQKDDQAALREHHNRTPRKKEQPLQQRRPVMRPKQRTRQTSLAPSAIRAKNPPTTHARATSCGRLTG